MVPGPALASGDGSSRQISEAEKISEKPDEPSPDRSDLERQFKWDLIFCVSGEEELAEKLESKHLTLLIPFRVPPRGEFLFFVHIPPSAFTFFFLFFFTAPPCHALIPFAGSQPLLINLSLK